MQRLLLAVGNTFLSMISLVAGALTNIILDPILIFACHMGIAGAAIATVIGQWVGAAAALGLNAAANHEVRLTFKDFRMSRATIWPIYKVGLPTILTQAMGAIMLFSMNAILGALLPGLTAAGTAASAPAIAFFGAYNKLQNFLYMPMHGLGNGMVNMVGTCLRQFIPLVPLAFLFGKLGGIGSIWYAMWISEALAVLFAAFSARKIFGKKLSILNVTEG